ncbi:hypothetical protein [Pacificibacter marinus]|uniref:hypothetical protein n=1 Tax=Pacificibacter marinus TaxID=658057 RepID=UPI0008D34753|nr:hypothetical protein [Pacificibacter marinus]SEK54617.1 hypothetical protein SAMN04488032_103257 [Pacificibacter marinus]
MVVLFAGLKGGRVVGVLVSQVVSFSSAFVEFGLQGVFFWAGVPRVAAAVFVFIVDLGVAVVLDVEVFDLVSFFSFLACVWVFGRVLMVGLVGCGASLYASVRAGRWRLEPMSFFVMGWIGLFGSLTWFFWCFTRRDMRAFS